MTSLQNIRLIFSLCLIEFNIDSMIKGNTRERLEYVEYVRETAIYVEDIFLPLRTNCEILSRFYRMQLVKRELSPFEIVAANLASLTAYCSCHIGSLFYIWLRNEAVPWAIRIMNPMEPTRIVSMVEMSELFLKYPKTVLEATILRANISYSLASDAMKAYKDKDSETLSDILSKAEISSIWPSFMLMDQIDSFSTLFQNTDWLDFKGTALMIQGNIQDIVDTKYVGAEVNIDEDLFHQSAINQHEVFNKFERLANRLEAEDSEACKDLIGASIILSRMLYDLFKANYGELDPVVETMNSIISNAYFIGIESMYKDIINIERIEGYLTRLGNMLSLSVESIACESKFSNEATDNTLMRFFDNMLVFDGQKRIEFINKYLNHLTDFFIAIDNKIALYSFASLFYPIVLKLGRYSEDKVTAATRLSGGIQWKTYPENDNKVINLIIALNPTQFNKLKPCKEESLSPARRMDYLIKLASNQTSRYSWIKDFIDDYWPQVAREEFERKYKIKK